MDLTNKVLNENISAEEELMRRKIETFCIYRLDKRFRKSLFSNAKMIIDLLTPAEANTFLDRRLTNYDVIYRYHGNRNFLIQSVILLFENEKHNDIGKFGLRR